MPAPWDQQEDEPEDAYRAFLVYRDLEPKRGLRPAYRKATGYSKATAASGQWVKWSRRYCWKQRACAWDEREGTEGLQVTQFTDLVPFPQAEGWRGVFFEELSRHANVLRACKAARISRVHVYRLRRDDDDFAVLWALALDDAVDLAEEKLRELAVEGYLQPIFYQGAKIAEVRRYNVGALLAYLRAHRPEKWLPNFDYEKMEKDLDAAEG